MIRTVIKYLLVPVTVWQVAVWLAALSQSIAMLQILVGAVAVIVLLRDRSPDLPTEHAAQQDGAAAPLDPDALDLDTTSLFTDADQPLQQQHPTQEHCSIHNRTPHTWTRELRNN